MTLLLLVLQLFTFPVSNAYAVQKGKDLVVNVTYTMDTPTSVCAYLYEVADEEMAVPTDSQCLKKITSVSGFFTWRDTRIDMVNIKVIVKYPVGPPDQLALVWKVNT